MIRDPRMRKVPKVTSPPPISAPATRVAHTHTHTHTCVIMHRRKREKMQPEPARGINLPGEPGAAACDFDGSRSSRMPGKLLLGSILPSAFRGPDCERAQPPPTGPPHPYSSLAFTPSQNEERLAMRFLRCVTRAVAGRPHGSNAWGSRTPGC